MTRPIAFQVGPGRPRLGEILVREGLLQESQIAAALAEQRKWGDRLGATLVHMGLISEEALAEALSRQLRLPISHPDREALPRDVTDHLGVHECDRYGVMPLGIENGVLRVATSDPTNTSLLVALARVVGQRVEPVVATESAIGRAIRKHYYGEPIDTPDPGGMAILSPSPAPPPTAPAARSPILDPPPQERTVRPPGASGGSTTGSFDVDVDLALEADLELTRLRETVERIEGSLTREVRALRVLVETLVERGVITRDELQARLRAWTD